MGVDGIDPDGMDALEKMSLSFGASSSYASKTEELMSKVTALQEALASGEVVDVTIQIALILGLIVEIGGDIVQDDADSLTATDKYLAVAADMQTIVSTQNGAEVQDINPFTGQGVTKDGVAQMVLPEIALANATQYLINNPNTQYNLNSEGMAIQATDEDGNLIYDGANPVWEENPIYDFFLANPELADSTIANVESVVMGLQDEEVGIPEIGLGTAGYTIDPATGQVTGFGREVSIPSDTGTGAPGLIQNMWDQTEGYFAEDGETYISGDPAISQQTLNGMASLNQSLTSNSSAVQALAQADAQTLNAQETTLNKFLQAMISQMKTMVQSQKSG